MIYTGVGSRATNPKILRLMTEIAVKMSASGYTLRSGRADGADKAFESGAGGLKEIFRPWQIKDPNVCKRSKEALEIAGQFHPIWNDLEFWVQKLHARNVFQVLGYNMDTPSDMLICWTPDGCNRHATRGINTGGTGTAISIADHYNVPVNNLAVDSVFKRWSDWVNESSRPIKHSTIIKGDLISLAESGEFDVIVHGCNCFHIMGAGIAKQVRDRYPEAYLSDRNFTKKGDRSKLGGYTCTEVNRSNDASFIIVNAYTQYNYGRDRVYTDYDAIRSVFRQIADRFPQSRVGYPKIGAGLSGGDWNRVFSIINDELKGMSHTLVEYEGKDIRSNLQKPRPLTIKTAHYRYSGKDRLDITAKKEHPLGKYFAPSWDMVNNVKKKGRSGEADYIKEYTKILDDIPEWVYHSVLAMGNVTLVCFCNKESFCHRNLLVERFVDRYGAKYLGFVEVSGSANTKVTTVVTESYSSKTDGKNHINIYSKACTHLGRFLTNFARTPIDTEDGHFESVEGYWYWLKTGNDDLRKYYGYKAKEVGKKKSTLLEVQLPFEEFKRKILDACRIKLTSNFKMYEEFIKSTLPFTHYYEYHTKVTQAGHEWLIDEGWKKFRDEANSKASTTTTTTTKRSSKFWVTEQGDLSHQIETADSKLSTLYRKGDALLAISKNINEPRLMEFLLKHKEYTIFHCTITGYGGSKLESEVALPSITLACLRMLIERGFPANQIVLRIDPIIPSYHGIKVAKDVLNSCPNEITRVRFSFIDGYDHVKPILDWDSFHAPAGHQKMAMDMLYDGANGRSLEACGEPQLRENTGCISPRDYEILGLPVPVASRKGQRKGCLCLGNKTELLSKPNKCPNSCLYCYYRL